MHESHAASVRAPADLVPPPAAAAAPPRQRPGAAPRAPTAPWARLVGRAVELDRLCVFVSRARADGGALLVTGQPGVGKTALVQTAAAGARDSGTNVLRSSASEAATDVAYAALHQLLVPITTHLDDLPGEQREALAVALGLRAGGDPPRLMVGNATLTLLRAASARRPVLLVVDDLQWIDRASADVLTFVTPRLSGSPVGLLAACRDDAVSPLDGVCTATLRCRPLDRRAAADLLGHHFPELADDVRRRVLDEAQGNPLALLELPTALSEPQREAVQPLPGVLPLSPRLEQIYAPQVRRLSPQAAEVLLLLGLDATGAIDAIQAAVPRRSITDDLDEADRAGLVVIDEGGGHVRFRHPLVRAAVVAGATSWQRRTAHRALAAATTEPRRRAFHLANATVQPDEEIAGQLADSANALIRRGDARAATKALQRAAELSSRPADRAHRLVRAAHIAATVSGDVEAANRLLEMARLADPTAAGASLRAAATTAYVLAVQDGDADTALRLLTPAIDAAGPGAGDDLASALATMYLLCRSVDDGHYWEAFERFVMRMEPRIPRHLRLLLVAADPVHQAAGGGLPLVEAAIDDLVRVADPWMVSCVGSAAVAVDRFAGCRPAATRLIRGGSPDRLDPDVLTAMLLTCLDHVNTGQWDDVERLAEAGLAQSRGRTLSTLGLRYHVACVAAMRGQWERARVEVDAMRQWGTPRGIGGAMAYTHHVLALVALGQGDFETAYVETTAVSPAGTIPRFDTVAPSVALNLVEAAIKIGRSSEAAQHVAALHRHGVARVSPRQAMLVDAASAVVAPDGDAAELFERALSSPDSQRWQFERARVHLLYGERLRRLRAPSEARTQLTLAHATFQRLGATPWAERALGELRASGAAVPRTAGRGGLTPQELEIATLAASGATNKQIAQRLYLSHRTVGAHLYRIFPKLGITSRAGLRDALDALAAEAWPPGG